MFAEEGERESAIAFPCRSSTSSELLVRSSLYKKYSCHSVLGQFFLETSVGAGTLNSISISDSKLTGNPVINLGER